MRVCTRSQLQNNLIRSRLYGSRRLYRHTQQQMLQKKNKNKVESEYSHNILFPTYFIIAYEEVAVVSVLLLIPSLFVEFFLFAHLLCPLPLYWHRNIQLQ